MTHVKFVYFKESGKYYSEGELDLFPLDDKPHVAFHDAVERVRVLLDSGDRPGLVDGFGFHILVTVYTEHGPLPWLFTRFTRGTLESQL